MRHLIFLIFLIPLNNVDAQVDTSVWYPLHIGDKWEYYDAYYGYSQVEIIGDTLMPNGKNYFIHTLYDRKYQRVDSNRYVMVYNEYAADSEYVRFDLLAVKGDIFNLATSKTGGYYGYGVYETGDDRNNFLEMELDWKEYREVYIDTTVIPKDTIWNEIVDSYWPRITKGLGVSSYAFDLEALVGAVINGVGYGTLVDIEKNSDVVYNFQLYQNYPNPFNPTTVISYSIPQPDYVTLKIFDLLGNEIQTLVDKYQTSGQHKIHFNGEKLASGVYVYCLITGNNFITSRKLLLLK